MNKRKNLEKTLGGKWAYNGPAYISWDCDDGRHVVLCSAGVDEWDNSIGPGEYWLYQDGKVPERAEKYIFDQKHIKINGKEIEL